jgi:hypothetical protein
MIALLCFFLALLVSLFKPKSRLEAENAALLTTVCCVNDSSRNGNARLLYDQSMRTVNVLPQSIVALRSRRIRGFGIGARFRAAWTGEHLDVSRKHPTFDPCVYQKSDSAILVMKSAEDRL